MSAYDSSAAFARTTRSKNVPMESAYGVDQEPEKADS